MVRGAALLLLAALLHSACAAPRPEKEPALRSEEEDGFDNDGWLTDECSEDDEDNPDLHPFQCGYELSTHAEYEGLLSLRNFQKRSPCGELGVACPGVGVRPGGAEFAGGGKSGAGHIGVQGRFCAPR